LIGIKPGDALEMSLERLELAVAAQQRVDAQRTLELAQGIASGTNGGDAWRKWQERMISKMKRVDG
jgi:hypothetical protein